MQNLTKFQSEIKIFTNVAKVFSLIEYSVPIGLLVKNLILKALTLRCDIVALVEVIHFVEWLRVRRYSATDVFGSGPFSMSVIRPGVHLSALF